jgi:hypothetical protein
MQPDGTVENQKAGFPQFLESAIHSSHSPGGEQLLIVERKPDVSDAGQHQYREGAENRIFPK